MRGGPSTVHLSLQQSAAEVMLENAGRNGSGGLLKVVRALGLGWNLVNALVFSLIRELVFDRPRHPDSGRRYREVA